MNWEYDDAMHENRDPRKARRVGQVAAAIALVAGFSGTAESQHKPSIPSTTWAGRAANCIAEGKTIDCSQKFEVTAETQ